MLTRKGKEKIMHQKEVMSSREYREFMEGLSRRGAKYHSKKEVCDGITFDSKSEGERYRQLKILENAGEIAGLKLQPSYLLQEGFQGNNGKNYRPIYYRGDFQYLEKSTGQIVIEDVKGVETQVFKLKEKMFRKRYPDIDLRILDSRDLR